METEHDVQNPASLAEALDADLIKDGDTAVGFVVPKELTLPSGEIVELADPASLAVGLARVREMESYLRSVKSLIVDAFAEEARRTGDNNIPLPDGTRVQVTRKYDTAWDHLQLEADLRELGMPEERIREIIKEDVVYTVAAVEANRAAKANPQYAEAVERARTKTEARPTISLPRG